MFILFGGGFGELIAVKGFAEIVRRVDDEQVDELIGEKRDGVEKVLMDHLVFDSGSFDGFRRRLFRAFGFSGRVFSCAYIISHQLSVNSYQSTVMGKECRVFGVFAWNFLQCSGVLV